MSYTGVNHLTMKIVVSIFSVFLILSCNPSVRLSLPKRDIADSTGNELYKSVFTASLAEREQSAKEQVLNGNVPHFLRKMVRINTSITSPDGKIIKAFYFVSSDYLSIGSEDDFARIPLTPLIAQEIADSLHCFLPTRKIVDDIYKAAKVKLEPVPMYIYRDSAITMYQHNLIIEGQRKGQKGLIAGIKKDVVISGKISRDPKPNRVAIYGWHKLDGKPIQPLYTGHVDWYADYSHGIRLVHRTIYVNNKLMDYTDVLRDPSLRGLLCDEESCDFYRYEVE